MFIKCINCNNKTNYMMNYHNTICYICSDLHHEIITENDAIYKYKIPKKILDECRKYQIIFPNESRNNFYSKQSVKYSITRFKNLHMYDFTKEIYDITKMFEEEIKLLENHRENTKNILDNLLSKYDKEYLQFYNKIIVNKLDKINNTNLSCNYIAMNVCCNISNNIENNKILLMNKINKLNLLKTYCELNNLDFKIIKKVPYANEYINNTLSIDNFIKHVDEYAIKKYKMRKCPYDDDDIYSDIKYNSINYYYGSKCLKCQYMSTCFCIITNTCISCCMSNNKKCCENIIINNNTIKKYKISIWILQKCTRYTSRNISYYNINELIKIIDAINEVDAIKFGLNKKMSKEILLNEQAKKTLLNEQVKI